MAASAGELKELQDLLKGYSIALLTTVGEDGHFHTRPMAMQHRDLSDGLWFATSEETEKVHDLARNPHCGVAFHEAAFGSTYLSLSGSAELIRDRSLIRRMWDHAWDPWFPGGPGQQDVLLIKVTPEHAEYVHPKTGRLQVLFTLAKRLLTRAHPHPATKYQIDLPH